MRDILPAVNLHPVLVTPVTGITAVGTVAVDGIVRVMVAFAVPAPTMLAVTPDRLNVLRFCISTPN